MSIDELNNQEYILISKVRQITGSIEKKDSQIDLLDIPIQYKKIHSDYTSMNHNEEALNRAIFIQWYSVAEPMTYSGIGNLNSLEEKSNLGMLKRLILEGRFDEEFRIMISYYHSISPWYFQSVVEVENFPNYLNIKLEYNVEISGIEKMVKRGLMGEYWNSLNRE